MYPEIVPARLSKADFAIRRAHKSGLEGRHVRAQILKRSDCQLLEHFLSAHVFALNMIQSSYDLHFGLITDLHSGGLQIMPERMADADCGRGRLVSRFRLASRSAASGGTLRAKHLP